ncbi:MAG: right-handed parallel beta-helix repeat-containing protein [Candidatus Bathyarchaeia archaeon]
MIYAFIPIPVEALNTRERIRITSNEEFTPANGVIGGSGTQEDPYVIEGWAVAGGDLPAIWLENTDAYVVIRNCVVGVSHDAGLKLEKVFNVVIENLSVNPANYVNVYIFGSENIRMSGCNLVNTREDAVCIYESKNIIIEGCRIGDGRYYSLYMNHVENVVVDGCDVFGSLYGVYAEASSGITIRNCAIHDNLGDGVKFYSVQNSTISKCKLNANEDHGIFLDVSDRITVEGCEITNSSLGIWLNPAFDCRIVQNFFSNVHQNAQDDGERNLWEKNKWSDYKGADLNGDEYGDTPYRIIGAANSTDNKPFVGKTPQPTPTPQPSPRPTPSQTPFQTPPPTPSLTPYPSPSYPPETQGGFPTQLTIVAVAIAVAFAVAVILHFKRGVKH